MQSLTVGQYNYTKQRICVKQLIGFLWFISLSHTL